MVLAVISSKFICGSCGIPILDGKNEVLTVQRNRRRHTHRCQNQGILLGLVAHGATPDGYEIPLLDSIHDIHPCQIGLPADLR